VKIRHVMEQGADFRRQQVFRKFILYERHLAQGQRQGNRWPPGAMFREMAEIQLEPGYS
jgi:hypothetical protein